MLFVGRATTSGIAFLGSGIEYPRACKMGYTVPPWNQVPDHAIGSGIGALSPCSRRIFIPCTFLAPPNPTRLCGLFLLLSRQDGDPGNARRISEPRFKPWPSWLHGPSKIDHRWGQAEHNLDTRSLSIRAGIRWRWSLSVAQPHTLRKEKP